MLVTDYRLILTYNMHRCVQVDQNSALSTMCDFEFGRVPVFTIKVVIFRPVTDVHFDLWEFCFAFGTITPVAIFATMLLVQPAECVFAMIARTIVENR
jgi:hypothetical protein